MSNSILKDYGMPYLYKMMRTAMKLGEVHTVMELKEMIEKQEQKQKERK